MTAGRKGAGHAYSGEEGEIAFEEDSFADDKPGRTDRFAPIAGNDPYAADAWDAQDGSSDAGAPLDADDAYTAGEARGSSQGAHAGGFSYKGDDEDEYPDALESLEPVVEPSTFDPDVPADPAPARGRHSYCKGGNPLLHAQIAPHASHPHCGRGAARASARRRRVLRRPPVPNRADGRLPADPAAAIEPGYELAAGGKRRKRRHVDREEDERTELDRAFGLHARRCARQGWAWRSGYRVERGQPRRATPSRPKFAWP